MEPFKSILIIQTAFIGDAILASSLVEKLHRFYPACEISILVRKGNEGIYHNHPFLKEVLVWDKTTQKRKHLFELLRRIRHNRYDAVINCHRFASSGLLAAFSGARHIAGYTQNPFSFLFNYRIKHSVSNNLHEIERYNQLIEDFTDGVAEKPRLYPSESDEQKITSLLKPTYVCMAPASVWFTKQLPENKWMELINRIPANQTIYLLGAPGDVELCRRIQSGSRHPDVQILAGQLSLLQSCALMRLATMNYVNDSAPLHLASSVNAPVTAFFLSTVPEFGFGPLSQNATILQVSSLECRPCGLHGFKACPKGHFKCGNNMPLA